MYHGLLDLHNFLRWIIILLGIIAVYKSFIGMMNNKPFTAGDKKIGLFFMISAHITLLVGLYQWFVGPWGFQNIKNSGFAVIMKDPVSRFFAIEHMTGMIIAIILITIGRGVSKKNIPDAAKHKKTFWFFFVAMIIIFISVPWPFRAGIGRPWFPGVH